MTHILVPLSPAEAVERCALLTLRLANTTDPKTQERLQTQIADLNSRVASLGRDADAAALYQAHADLLALQSDIRAHDARNDFGPGFVALARAHVVALEHLDALRVALAGRD